jgi:superfamily II DNA helicase RecQ
VSLVLRAMTGAESVARGAFSVDVLRKEQMEVITAITGSENVIAVLPTGFGKSLCYQVGAMMLNGFTLVITPLLALCEDQIVYMSAHNIPVVRMDSTIERDEQVAVCTRVQCEDSDVKAVYTTPETLRQNKNFGNALRAASAQGRISFVTIDEAHCVLEWSDFRCVMMLQTCFTLVRCIRGSTKKTLNSVGRNEQCAMNVMITGLTMRSWEKRYNG